jgi:secreted trypsin-like serine protease
MVLVLFTFLSLLVSHMPATAVVNGSEITDADVSKPWVAQIYYSESASSYNEPEFICSGSLISENKVLTAAHCVLDKGFYFVTLGARTLNSNAPLLEVESVWRNPRYSDRKIVNDIGVLKLTNPVLTVSPIPLASNSMTKKINAATSYTVYGWGIDQNKSPAVYLKTAKLTNQDRVAKSRLNKFGYSSTTMLAAGNYLKNERIYAGVCNGDSGGPLVSIINGVETLIGVTSWGITDRQGYCDLGYPSVFSRVTYFLRDINAGISIAERSAVDNNRAAPSYSVKPAITGSARVGSIINCDTGKWSSNTTQITYKWTSPWGATGIKSQSIQLTANDAGQTFTCVVTGSSRAASLPVTSSVSIPSKPSSYSYADISGIESYSTIKTGTTATCSGVKWNSPVDSESVQWYSSPNGYSFTATTSVLLGTGSSLALSAPILQSLFGKYLVCSITGVNGGGTTSFTDYVYISKPSAPYYVSATITGLPSSSAPAVGTVATCTGSTSSTYDSMSYEWGYGTSSWSSYSTPLANSLGKNSTLTLTQEIIDTVKSKYLVCVATATNLGGSTSGYDTEFVTAPIVRVPGAPTIGVATAVTGTSATVSFIAPISNGNSTITSYVATSSPGLKIGSVSQSGSGTITITGLTAGTSYTFTVTAINSAGTSIASSQSNSITTPTPSASPTPTPSASPTPTPSASPTPTPALDTTPPIGSNWNSPGYTYPSGTYTTSFKATDNVAVTRTQFVLVKNGIDVLTQAGSAIPGQTDFYSASMTIPSNASGVYEIRFEAFDAAGNKYSRQISGATTIVTTPVYLGGSNVTKSGDPNKLSAGDIFTCNIGNWVNTNPNTPVTCEWVTPGPRVRGTTFNVSTEIAALSSYSFMVILRLSGNSQIDGYWITWFMQVPGGLESKSDLDLYNKVFTK